MPQNNERTAPRGWTGWFLQVGRAPRAKRRWTSRLREFLLRPFVRETYRRRETCRVRKDSAPSSILGSRRCFGRSARPMPSYRSDGTGDRSASALSRSPDTTSASNSRWRSRVRRWPPVLLTAMASARGWAISTTKRLPRVTAV
jgi:hypothetical protein